MKKKHLEKTLQSLGWKFKREGGNHEIWSKENHKIPVPRHREIREGTARAIINQAKKIKGQNDEI